MSDLRDGFRQHRRELQRARAERSVLCWKCGTRVWQEEKTCRTCGTDNDCYKAQQQAPQTRGRP